MSGFIDCLEGIEDRRKDINKIYDLTDMIFLTMAAVASGASGWRDIQLFGTYKLEWLRQYRPFTHGIPTRHTIGRIIRGISAHALMEGFAVWINQEREKTGSQHIAFDGKTLRGSGHNNHVEAIHMMSAMVVESGITLFQAESQGKKNEIKTMQDMLDIIPVKGHVLSADAMHCQKKTLAKAREKEADVVLQVKGNQKALKADIEAWFHKCRRDEPDKIQEWSETDGGHGRIVERCYRLLPADDWITELQAWPGITSLVEVSRTTHRQDKTVSEVSYHISTLENLDRISEVIRRHWQIESHHWILDVTFHEDESLIYAEDGAKNMALFRRMLLNLAKANPSKGSMAGKLKKAGWDDNFRAELLFG